MNAGLTLHRLLNKHEKSISWFNRAIVAHKKAPSDEGVQEWYAAAFFNKGEALMSLSRLEEAIINFQKAIDILEPLNGDLMTENYKNHWINMAKYDIAIC